MNSSNVKKTRQKLHIHQKYRQIPLIWRFWLEKKQIFAILCDIDRSKRALNALRDFNEENFDFGRFLRLRAAARYIIKCAWYKVPGDSPSEAYLQYFFLSSFSAESALTF